MKLDDRIIEGKKPLDCFDAENEELIKPFLNKEGYFSNNIENFCLLDGCFKRLLSNVFKKVKDCFKTSIHGGDGGDWKYFLPAEWVKSEEPKKKYRPFTMNEFKATFNINKILTLRRINEPDNIYTIVYLGYRQYDESDNEKNHIYLTNGEFSLKGLFNNFEIYSSEGWKPFGIEVEE